MASVKKYTVGKVMQLIPINDELNEFSMDFYLKGNDEFHFAVCDQNALDNGTALDFKQSSNKEVSGNIKSNGEPKSYYIALKSINEKVEINVSLAPRPVDMTPKPEAPQQQRPPPQQQRPPPQQLSSKDPRLSSKDPRLSSKDPHLSSKDLRLVSKDLRLNSKGECHLRNRDLRLNSKGECRLVSKDLLRKTECLLNQFPKDITTSITS
jgi:hypothetical protein